MDELIRLLNEGNYSCVVRQGEETRTFPVGAWLICTTCMPQTAPS